MSKEVFEIGSQVQMGLSLCKRMDLAHMAAGRLAYQTGDTSQLWSAIHWAAYNQAAVEDGVALFTGAPAAARWAAGGAPSCGATWDGDYRDIDAAENRDDFIGE